MHRDRRPPKLDPAFDELVNLPPTELHRLLRSGVERDDETTPFHALPVLRDSLTAQAT